MWSSTAGECILFMHIQNTFPFYNLVPYIKIKLIMSSSQVFLKWNFTYIKEQLPSRILTIPGRLKKAKIRGG